MSQDHDLPLSEANAFWEELADRVVAEPGRGNFAALAEALAIRIIRSDPNELLGVCEALHKLIAPSEVAIAEEAAETPPQMSSEAKWVFFSLHRLTQRLRFDVVKKRESRKLERLLSKAETRKVLSLLFEEGPCSPSNLVERIPGSTKYTISQRLRPLREAGIVEATTVGRSRQYSLTRLGIQCFKKMGGCSKDHSTELHGDMTDAIQSDMASVTSRDLHGFGSQIRDELFPKTEGDNGPAVVSAIQVIAALNRTQDVDDQYATVGEAIEEGNTPEEESDIDKHGVEFAELICLGK